MIKNLDHLRRKVVEQVAMASEDPAINTFLLASKKTKLSY